MSTKTIPNISKGFNYVVPACPWTRDGYSFVCWNTQSDGSGTSYYAKGNISIDSNKMLYALWEKNESPEPAIQYVVGPMDSMCYTSVGKQFNGNVAGITSDKIRSIFDYSGLNGKSYDYWTGDKKRKYLYKIPMNNLLKRYICIEDSFRIIRDRVNGFGSACEFCLVFENTANNEKTTANVNTVYVNFTVDKSGNSIIVSNYNGGCVGSDIGKTKKINGSYVTITEDYCKQHQTEEYNEKIIIDLQKCHIDYAPRFTNYDKLTSTALKSINQYVGGLSIGFDSDGYAYLKWDGSGAKNGFGDIDSYPPYMYFALYMSDTYVSSGTSDFGTEFSIGNLKIRTNNTGVFN